MKRIAGLAALLLAALPALAAGKLTIDELRAKMLEMHQAYKDDATVADWLKTVDLSQQMTRLEHEGMERISPGPLTTIQLAILEGKSAFLLVSAANLPGDPAPDAAAQQALLAKATAIIGQSYAQLPHMTVIKSMARFQDSPRNTSSTAGLEIEAANPFEQIMETRVETVENDRGQERPAPSKAKTRWGANKFVSEGDPPPSLSQILSEAQASGKLAFVRWEKLGPAKTAVFSFAVEKKKTKFALNYCCFPVTDETANVAQSHLSTAPAFGDIQSVTTWRPYKKQMGYHGQIYIEAESGAVLRVVVDADAKPTETVHQELTRIDFAGTTVNGQTVFLPEAEFVVNEVVANADNPNALYQARHVLTIATYKDYKAN